MKKKLALLLSAVMIASMVPMTAFATSKNTVNRIVTAEDGEKYTSANSPVLTLEDNDLNVTPGAVFKLTLTNAEWNLGVDAGSELTLNPTGEDGFLGVEKVQVLSSTQVIVTATAQDVNGKNKIYFPLATTLKGDGEASVYVDPMSSVVTGGSLKFGNVVTGSTVTTIEKKTDLPEGGDTIKPIVITEIAKGTLKFGEEIKVKLSNDFNFKGAQPTIVVYPSTASATAISTVAGEGEFTFKLTGSANEPMTISISGLKVDYDSDDISVDTVADITVSGAGLTKQTIDVGTAVGYGVSIKAEDKTLPVFIAGRDSGSDDTLKVTFKETVKESWLQGRKTTMTLPEGVKVDVADGATLGLTDVKGGLAVTAIVEQKDDYSVVKFEGTGTRSGKVEFKFKFPVSVDPSFKGDIVAKFAGAGITNEGSAVDVVLGTVKPVVEVEAETNEVSIDYRNVAIGDIIIKETEAGNLEKDKTLYLDIEEMRFDGTPEVEVVEGDIKIDKVKVDGGRLAITIKTASNKTPGVLKVTGNQLFLDRTLPAGSYELAIVKGSDSSDAIFKTYDKDAEDQKFDTDEVTVLKDFIEVITGGRDQAETFTTKIAVTIGADKLIAGKTEVALDVPAYISEGYTLLPVRAVTEALSTSAIVKWDDATKTATITFGSRIVNITVGSKTMNINGVPVQMAKAAEITDSRAFIPLRDLGYALGLNDSKINWDDATKTATLN